MNNSYGTWTLFKRESKRFLKVYRQTILAPVVSNLLFLSIFALSLTRAVQTVGDLSYLQFLVPGLVIMGVMNNAYQNPSSSLMIMKYQGLISDILSIPLKRTEVMLAIITSAVLRGFIVGIVTLLTASFFVDLTYDAVGILLLATFLIALIFSFLGFIVGIWADEFDKNAVIQNFILTPLTFLGGVFYPVTTLPDVFQTISKFNPIVYMIDLVRYGFTGVHELPISLSLTVVSLFTLFIGIFCHYLFKSGYKLQT